MTTYVPIPEILRSLRGSIDNFAMPDGSGINWDDWFADKIPEAIDADLDTSLLRDGFEFPIGIRIRDDGLWVQHNGHHRLAIAIWLCLDSVPVIFVPAEGNGWYAFDDDGEWLFGMTGE